MADIYKTKIENRKLWIPDELKDYFTDKEYILSRGMERGTICLYRKADWAVFEERLHSLVGENQNVRRFVRYFIVSAEVTEMENGTLEISEYLYKLISESEEVSTMDVRMYFDGKFCDKLVIESGGRK